MGPALKRDQVEHQLKRKFGFQQTKRQDHREYVLMTSSGMIFCRTKVSHGTSHRDISGNLIAAMARQVRVDSQTFYGMISCTTSRDAYYKMIGFDEAKDPQR